MSKVPLRVGNLLSPKSKKVYLTMISPRFQLLTDREKYAQLAKELKVSIRRAAKLARQSYMEARELERLLNEVGAMTFADLGLDPEGKLAQAGLHRVEEAIRLYRQGMLRNFLWSCGVLSEYKNVVRGVKKYEKLKQKR